MIRAIVLEDSLYLLHGLVTWTTPVMMTYMQSAISPSLIT